MKDLNVEIIKPPRLKQGDKVSLITPAGKATQVKIDAVANALQELGLKPIIDEQNYKVDENSPYHPGAPEDRAAALNNAFADKSIKAIFCVRGGEGVLDLLNKVDYELVKQNPKIFVGISDVTIMQSALYKKAGLETYHGPVFIHFMEEKEFAKENLKQILFDDAKEIDLGIEEIVINGENTEGILVGGNLTSLTLIPEEFWYTNEGIILLVEDLNEYRFRMNRCLSFLQASGRLDNVKAVVVGRNHYNDDDDFGVDFNQVLLNRFADKNIPVVSGAKFGHLNYQLTLPIGRKVKMLLSGDKAKLIKLN